MWDEAEVRAGKAGGSGARATGRPRWREGRRWLRGSGRARSRDWGRLVATPFVFGFFLADSGLIEAKSWLSHSAELTALNLKRKNYFFSQQDGIGEEVLKMSTEEIIQRTRLLDSEIKVSSEAPSRCPRPHTQGRSWCSHRVVPGLPRTGVGTAVFSSDQKKRKERDGRGPGWWETRPERGNGQTALPSLVWEVFLFRVCLLRNPHVTDEHTEAKRVLFCFLPR